LCAHYGMTPTRNNPGVAHENGSIEGPRASSPRSPNWKLPSASRRIVRHLAEASLPPRKTLDNFDFAMVPMLSKARVMGLAAGDASLDKASNLLCFGPPGAGKSHVSIALAGFGAERKELWRRCH
jgi:DNA replication protein DnaC